MKVCIVLLTHNRPDLTEKVINQNLANTFYPFDLCWVDNGSTDDNFNRIAMKLASQASTVDYATIGFKTNQGISHGQNHGIKHAMDNNYDVVVLMSNDILMPSGWLKEMVEHATAIPETGTIGIFCVEGRQDYIDLKGKEIHPTTTAFGNIFIPKGVIEKVGYQNTDYDPYGMNDADFALRVTKAGFLNYYLYSIKSEHIGHDVDQKDEYRLMKDEGLKRAAEVWERWKGYYEQTGNYYLPFEQENYIINQDQMIGV